MLPLCQTTGDKTQRRIPRPYTSVLPSNVHSGAAMVERKREMAALKYKIVCYQKSKL